MGQRETVEAYNGREVAVEPIKQLENGGARVEIDATDGPRWRVDVTRSGSVEVVTSWDADGNLADVEMTDWAEDVLERMRGA